MKRILMLGMIGVFGAASVAVAGPLNVTVAPNFQKGTSSFQKGTPNFQKGVGKGQMAAEKPDYIPQVRNPFAGVIKVKNQGGSARSASKLVMTCKNIDYTGGGGCPDSPALHRYYNASFDAMVVDIPPLRAGQVYTVSLPMKGLKWSKGQYNFSFKADATAAIAESNERNNLKRVAARR